MDVPGCKITIFGSERDIASACRRRMKDNKSRPINAATGGVSELTPS